MQKQISPKITALAFGVLVISFLAAFYAVAWQEPTQAPPGGNVPAPLNVGSEGQSKEGWLHTLKSIFIGGAPSIAEQGATGILRTTGGAILNTGGAENALIVDKGKICIGADCIASWPKGTITGVIAGTTLTGGGDSGEVALNLGTAYKGELAANQGYRDLAVWLGNPGFRLMTGSADCPAGQYAYGIRVDVQYNTVTISVKCRGK
jgi:hypothetical protein